MKTLCRDWRSRAGGRGVGLALAGLLVVGQLGCEPDIGQDPIPEYMVFDVASDPPVVPLPNVIGINQTTGLIDNGLPNDPAVCATLGIMSPAQCEFYLYLQTLDGFPTQSPVTVPASAELDLATLTSDNLAVFATSPLTGLDLSWDNDTGEVVIEYPDSWDVGQDYVVAIRGYDTGVKTVDGDRVVAPTTYSLLKREESLINCEPDPPNPSDLVNPVVDRDCKYFILLAQDYDVEDPADASAIAAVEAGLVSLETLRQGFLANDLWSAVELVAGMPKDEVAMVFSFPTHSGPVVELNPDTGVVPEMVNGSTLRMAVKGDIDPTTLVPGLPFTATATIALINVDAMAVSDIVNALPTFDATFIDGHIELQNITPLVPGAQYVFMLRTQDPYGAPNTAVMDMDGNVLVPPPAVVALRSPHPVYDADTDTSLIDSFDAPTAEELETNRLTLVDLIEDPLFATHLTRYQVGFVFAFTLPSP